MFRHVRYSICFLFFFNNLKEEKKMGVTELFLGCLRTVVLPSISSETDTPAGMDSVLVDGKLSARQKAFANFLKSRKRWG